MSRIRWYQAGVMPFAPGIDPFRFVLLRHIASRSAAQAVILEDDPFREGNPVRHGRRVN